MQIKLKDSFKKLQKTLCLEKEINKKWIRLITINTKNLKDLKE